MVIWITPFVVTANPTHAVIKSPHISETSRNNVRQLVGTPAVGAHLINSQLEEGFLRGWCEIETTKGIRRVSVTLSGAMITDWPATQGLRGQVELQLDFPKNWNFDCANELKAPPQGLQITGSPAQLLGQLAHYSVKRLRFSLRNMPIEIRPRHKDCFALLILGDADYLILTTPRLPGDRVYRRIARQVVLKQKVENGSLQTDLLLSKT